MTYLASFVITCFNQAEYIADAIESCLNQTVDSVEVVVVDDGSVDQSPYVLSKFAADPRIKLIMQSNEGPSAAFNAGVSASTGKYIAWLGGDDISLPSRIERQLEALKASGADIAFCIPDVIGADGVSLDKNHFPIFNRPFNSDELLGILLSEGNFFCAPTAFMDRAVLDKVGPLRRGLVQLQDYEYWIRSLQAGLKIFRDDEAVVQYRRHEANLSSAAGSFASSCELAIIVGDALDHPSASRAIRKTSFHLLPPTSDADRPLSSLEKVMFLLSSPDAQVRGRGARQAIEFIEHEEFRTQLLQSNLTYPTFLTASLLNPSV